MKKILLLILIIPTFVFSQNGPTASFIYNPVCLGTDLVLTDFSYPDPTTNSQIASWDWQYNGNSISSTQNASYLFSQCGTYDITLTVTDADGISDDTTINVEVFCPPIAGFFNDIVCSGDPTNFVDVSTPGDGTPPLNSGSTWMYIFGDADPPNAVNPNCTATFNYAGIHSVMFIVSEIQFNGQYCIDTLIQDVQVDSCFVGIENNISFSSKKIINNYNILGKSRKLNSKDLNIIIYDDGTVKKKIIIE